jgi:poly(hydroxyalkanoate) granule-associated protein
MPHSGKRFTANDKPAPRRRRRRQTGGEDRKMTGKVARKVGKKAPQTKAKELQQDMAESAHKIWLAGLGAMAVAEEEGSKLFRSLVERGQDVEGRGKEQVEKAKGTVAGVKTVAESYWGTFERTVDEQMTAVIHRIGVPTKSEIEDLTRKVEDLTKSVEKLRAQKTTAASRPAAKTAKAAPKKK